MNRSLLVAAGALILAACAEAPTSSSPTTTDGSSLAQVPTGTPSECPAGTTGATGTLPGSGALYLICVPPGFDPATGSLVVYAHGSVPPQQPLALPNDELAGVPLAQIATLQLGFAYATTSYRENGLIVVDAEKDLQRLVAKFRELYGPIGGQTYAAGASEGGLIVTLATERHPQLFDGTIAFCAPIGDFQRQLNYFDDFRLAFDFYFPTLGQSLGDPIHIPATTISQFTSPAFTAALAAAVASDPQAANNLMAAAGIPLQVNPQDPTTIAPVVTIIQRLLAYNVLFTNQTQQTLGGQPYDNVTPTDYSRVIDFDDLRQAVPTFQADQPAISHLNALYQTSGRLQTPLVTLYNQFDPIVPSWNETVYAQKVAAAGASDFLVAQLQSQNQFGHCNFTLQDVLNAFGTLTQAVTGTAIAAAR